ncbi:hypothetical protein C5Y96_16765 [Blastopirellula marina]|uniref:DUF304 domain-containing protein n=1 Tax=Blastopirellula marina TaxID=124 RepID=A0A2S8F798_9BACT|nr:MULTISPECIES: hypothetical protein [Pirellulaceae]PQO28027.1 hypothetical protein C5Y96_16765 [Blastopirellula marina]RCS48452.1 hypothetical protein DTL36_16785 [Bremerella cremea]
MSEDQANPFASPTEKSHNAQTTFPQRFSLPITLAIAGVFSVLVGCWLGLVAYLAGPKVPPTFWYVVMAFLVIGVLVLKGAIDTWHNGRLQLVDHQLCGRFRRERYKHYDEIDLREIVSFQFSGLSQLINSPATLRLRTKDNETYEFYCKWFTPGDYQQLNEILASYCPSNGNA